MRYLAEHPLPTDTTVQVVTEWRDTTFYVPVPADTVRDSVPVVLPCPAVSNYASDTAKAVGRYATAKAWIKNGQLHVDLTMNDAQLEFHVDSLAAVRTKTVTVTQQVTVKEKIKPPLYRASLFVNLFFIVLFLLILFLVLRRR
jgi:hypothetical protein